MEHHLNQAFRAERLQLFIFLCREAAWTHYPFFFSITGAQPKKVFFFCFFYPPFIPTTTLTFIMSHDCLPNNDSLSSISGL